MMGLFSLVAIVAVGIGLYWVYRRLPSNLQRPVFHGYRRLTPDTYRNSWLTATIVVILFTLAAGFLYGTYIGAYTAVENLSLSQFFINANAIEMQAWENMANENLIIKSIWAVVYPLIAGVFLSSYLGVIIGYGVTTLLLSTTSTVMTTAILYTAFWFASNGLLTLFVMLEGLVLFRLVHIAGWEADPWP